jgi:hypothetical protein
MHKLQVVRTMDWRLIAALSSAGGSLCLVAIGAYAVISANPGGPPPGRFAAAPMLLSEQRPASAAGAPVLVSTLGSSTGSSTQSSVMLPPSAPNPFDTLVPVTAPNTVGASGAVLAADSPVIRHRDRAKPPGPPRPPVLNAEPAHEPRPPPRKLASLTPADAAIQPPPGSRPIIEVRKPFVPEINVALPGTRYEGVLTTAEILRIKHNLRLTPDQEANWPPVAAALGEMGRQQIALIRRGLEPKISPADWPPQRLYGVAGPLLTSLRPDQKEQVRRLCRLLGFDSVASML